MNKPTAVIAGVVFLSLLFTSSPSHALKKATVTKKDKSGKVLDVLKADKILDCGSGLYIACDGKVEKTKKWVETNWDTGKDIYRVTKRMECRKNYRYYFSAPTRFEKLHSGGFQSATCFREDSSLNPAKKGGKYGLVRLTDGIRKGDHFLEVAIALPFRFNSIGSQCRPEAPYPKCDPTGIFPFKSGKKWGYMDSRGKVLIEPKFESAGPFGGKEFLTAKAGIKLKGLKKPIPFTINLQGETCREKDNTFCGKNNPTPSVSTNPNRTDAVSRELRTGLFPHGEPDGFDCRKWGTPAPGLRDILIAENPVEKAHTPQLTTVTYNRLGEQLLLWEIPFDDITYSFSFFKGESRFAGVKASAKGRSKWDRLVPILKKLYGEVAPLPGPPGIQVFLWEGRTTAIRATYQQAGETITLAMDSVSIRSHDLKLIINASLN